MSEPVYPETRLIFKAAQTIDELTAKVAELDWVAAGWENQCREQARTIAENEEALGTLPRDYAHLEEKVKALEGERDALLRLNTVSAMVQLKILNRELVDALEQIVLECEKNSVLTRVEQIAEEALSKVPR
jgi:chromosome segregation ATPase